MGAATPLAYQLDPPSRPDNPGDCKCLRRLASNPPAGHRRRGKAKRVGAALAPAAEQQTHCSIPLRRQLQPAGGSHIHPSDFADDCGKAAVPQSFLDHRQRVVVIAALGVDQALRGKPGLDEARGKQVAALEHPQHISIQPGRNPGGEQSCGGIIAERAVRARDFVKRSNRKSAAQPYIHLFNFERQTLGRTRSAACLNGSDLGAQRLHRVEETGLHRDWDDSFVLFMFRFCGKESIDSPPLFKAITQNFNCLSNSLRLCGTRGNRSRGERAWER